MKIRNILVVYKRTVYEKNFRGRSVVKRSHPPEIHAHLKRTVKVHEKHYRSLETICASLKAFEIPFKIIERGQKIAWKDFDIILTVGGDGTFMETAHQADGQIIIGVNSAPAYSVGRYCLADADGFRSAMQRVLEDKIILRTLYRLNLKIDGRTAADKILNDFLVTHVHPAMMSRYIISVGRLKEEQRSSGVWIASPSGTSGAVASAGGPVIAYNRKSMVYWVREAYQGFGRQYALKGSVFEGKSIRLISMMKDGMIYGDGSMCSVAFPYGAVAKISFSEHSLKTFQKA